MSVRTERGPAREAMAARVGGQHSTEGVHSAGGAGVRKLSEVILEFARSVMGDAAAGTFQGAARVAIVAWNLANLPADLRRAGKADLLRTARRFGSAYARQLGRVMDELVERKQRLYPDDARMVLDHAFTGPGRGDHLRVTAGALPEAPAG
ncbi:MAG TPA: hypothetical protein VFJ30_10275 [Phycisphaerae bacterium]|nr:hypothetical protein [Phycisphaerae bacterium]